MKKKIFILCILFTILTITSVQASTIADLTLSSSSNSVKPGDTFTVTIHSTCLDGINGFSANYSYDANNLELVSATICDSSKWSNLGGNNEIAIISTTSLTITDTNLFEFTFRVKETALVNSSSNIKLSNIMLDSDKTTDSKTLLADQEVFITIANITNSSPTPNENNVSSNTEENDRNQAGSVVNSSAEINNANNTVEKDKIQVINNVRPPEEINNTNNAIEENKNQVVTIVEPSKENQANNTGENNSNKIIAVSNSSIQENTLTVYDKIPYTGSNITFVLLLICSIILIFTSYFLYKKYKNVV